MVSAIAGTILQIWISAPGAAGSADGSLPPASLEELIAEARSRAPAVLEARANASASGARATSAWTPMNPMVEGAREVNPDMSRNMLTIRQDFMFPGRGWLEARAASAEARSADEMARAAELEAVARVKMGWFRLSRADGAIEAVRASRDLMVQAATVARSRVASAQAGADEYLLLQAEAVRLGSRLEAERNERSLAEAALAETLGRPRDNSRFGPAVPGPLLEPSRDPDELVSRARGASPDLSSAREMERAAGLMKSSASLGFLPGLSPFYQFQRFDGGMTGWMAGVGLSIPLWVTKPAGDLGRARAERDAAAARTAASDAALVRAVSSEAVEVRTHWRLASDEKEAVLPLLDQAVASAQARYVSGTGDVVRLLMAVRDQLDAKLDYLDHYRMWGEHWAALERAVGSPLEAP